MSSKDELDTLMERWQDVPAPDPQLKHRVWTRIAAEDTKAETGLPLFIKGLIEALSQPLGATAFVAASVVCGLLVAELRVNRIEEVRTEELAQNYIQLIEARSDIKYQEDSL